MRGKLVMNRRDFHTWINQFACNGPVNKHKHPFLDNHSTFRQWIIALPLICIPLLFIPLSLFQLYTNSLWLKISDAIVILVFLLELPLFIKVDAQRGNKGAVRIEGYSSYVSMVFLAIDIILIMWNTSFSHMLEKFIPGIELIILLFYINYLFFRDVHLSNKCVKQNINNPYVRIRKNKLNKLRGGYYMKISEDPKEHVTNEFNSRINKDVNDNLSGGVADSAIEQNASALVGSAISSTNDSTSNLASNTNNSTNTNLNNVNTNDNYDYHADFERTRHLLTEISNNDRDTFRSVVVLIVIFAIFVAVILFHIL